MRPMKRLILWGVLVLIMPLYAGSLCEFVAQKIRQYGFAAGEVSVYIKQTNSDRAIVALDIDTQRSPASLVKVYTTYAALLALGYDYRWRTEFYASSPLKQGVLQGDLIVKGYGDPTLKSEDIPGIVRGLRAQGLRKIEGDILIDRSYFEAQGAISANFDENRYSPYNALPDALMFNQQTSTFSLERKKGSYQVVKKIPGESYRIDNEIRSVTGSCRGQRAWPKIKIIQNDAMPKVHLSGTLSKHCRKRTFAYVVTPAYREFYAALSRALQQAGIAYTGNLIEAEMGAKPQKLYTHYSPTLEEVIAKTSKQSNNLFARHLLLTLGAELLGAPSTLDKGRKAVTQILNRYRLLDTPKCYIDNGCGLSRISTTTARSMVQTLEHAYAHYGQRWMKSLAIAGEDGTIKRRFRSSIVKNRAWMKTGSLKGVRNIAGYLRSESGALYTVVIIINSKRAQKWGTKFQNDILTQLVRYRGKDRVQVQVPEQPKKLRPSSGSLSSQPEGPRRAQPQHPKRSAYGVQVGAFSTQPGDELLARLEKKGYRYELHQDEDVTRVLVVGYPTYRAAKAAMQVLQSINPHAFIVSF
jgi:serine-type D-Ala-D-Ala carboxypeptidase/endopeptidase (penicillin-binding protein 4)